MIDLITLTKNGLSDKEIDKMVMDNKLQTNYKGDKVYYENIKNFKDGFYMRIETNNRLKLAVSLHKYKNLLDGKGFVNFDLFTMNEATETAQRLGTETGIDISELNVYGYEIGMNLYLKKDCRCYLDQIKTIGIQKGKKELWVNPRFKNERLKTTYLYREMRKVFKVYDKNFEMREKQRKEPTGHPNILRIETVFNRVERMPMTKFLSQKNIESMTTRFIKDWRTVQFSMYTTTPKGTSILKQDLCNKILTHGAKSVLNTALSDLESKRITPKQYRRIREFIQHDWDTFKTLIKVAQSEEEKEFREALNTMFILVK